MLRLESRVSDSHPSQPRFGIDFHGLWGELTLHGVVQRFRWMEPGEFLMGSPRDEAERHDDEGPQHRVWLSQGFWLADSQCTQALWAGGDWSKPEPLQGPAGLAGGTGELGRRSGLLESGSG